MNAPDHDVVVAGAGVTGLTCALRLRRAGYRVLVVERSGHVGGVIRSERVDGVGVIDHGPQTVRSADPALLDDFRTLGIEGHRLVAGSSGRNRYIVWDGRLVALPHGPGQAVRSRVLPASGKLRLLAEPFIRNRPGRDESVDDFFRHRLGRHAADRLVDPFVSGVYAGDPTQMSMRAVFPALKDGVDRAGSLARWAWTRARARREDGGGRNGAGVRRPKPELFSFAGGLGQWPEAMAAEVGTERVWTSAEVVRARRDGGGWVLGVRRDGATTTVRARALVLAVPSAAAASILGADHPAPARALDDIPYAPVTTVHLAYRREHVAHTLDGFGCLFPSSQGRPVLGILWISSLFPGRVQPGRVLTTTFVGGARTPERAALPDHDLITLVDAEHRRTLGASAGPVFARVVRWPQAIPQYEFGHLERVAAAERLEADAPGLVLAGAWRGGVSVPDCWKGGRAAADRVGAGLGPPAPVGVPGPAASPR